MSPRTLALAGGLIAAVASFTPSQAQLPAGTGPDVFRELRWRSIGPFRASRNRSATGHAARPYTFYAGVVNGGVWKTTDAGRTWFPIFDEQPTQSIGAVVVAPSNPDILYVGSGEGLQRPDLSVGDGVYKSVDGGRTWTHLGLRDAQQIANIAVDPRNPDRLFVAALGHPYGPNRERGIYRSTDGGRTFQPVLQKDENTGGNDVDIDPSNPQVVYANLWESRQGPWENAVWSGVGGIFKSVDGGATWRPLTNGLPEGVNQANIAIAPSEPRRLYATVATQRVGIYRSDDGGESWAQITTDTRPAGRIGGGDLPVPIVHPKNPDIVIMASTVSWKSVDGGRSWVPFKGAPGGEDYQGGWINPDNPDIIFMVADQGAVVSLNGGETWSSWYNQPTAQLYHVAADNAFPYRLCSGQQESGSACVASRGNYGAISDRDWLPVNVDEYGYVAVEGNYYEVPGRGRGKVQVLRYLHHLVLCQDRRSLIEYPLPPWGVRNQPFAAPGQKPPRYQPRNRKVSSQEEEKRLRAIDPVISAYVDFILGTPGLLRHQFLRRLFALSQRWSTTLFLRTIERAHRYQITSLETLQRIALLHLDQSALPDPLVDPELEKRPIYQEGSLTDTPDLSRYDE